MRRTQFYLKLVLFFQTSLSYWIHAVVFFIRASPRLVRWNEPRSLCSGARCRSASIPPRCFGAPSSLALPHDDIPTQEKFCLQFIVSRQYCFSSCGIATHSTALMQGPFLGAIQIWMGWMSVLLKGRCHKMSQVLMILVWSIFMGQQGVKAQATIPENSAPIYVFHKYSGDSLYLRWSPMMAPEWADQLEKGYVVQRFKKGQTVPHEIIIQKSIDSSYIITSEYENYLDLIYNLIFIEEVDEEDLEETFPSEDYTEAEILEARMDLVNFFITRKFEYITLAGLGMVDTDIERGVTYKFVVKGIGNEELVSDTLVFNSTTYTPPPKVILDAKWSDRRIDLSWNTREYRSFYYAYHLEKSLDGVHFESVDSNIIINPMDTSDMEVFHRVYRTDYLENNEDTYYYRLYGYDYFGHLSAIYDEVSGAGHDDVGLSPLIKESNQLKGNRVHLKWSLLDEFAHLVASWRIYVGEAWDGPYVLDTMDISQESRELLRPIPFGGTYFRVVAVDEFGKEYSSFPQLVMALDTLAPAVPVNIQYAIDTTGELTLRWDPNREPDFYGYKVFSSYDTLHEFVLRHEQFLESPYFVDTVPLRTELRYVYYKIISVDERNNRSEFSEILQVPIPDILPPVEPQFFEALPGYGEILLKWHLSPSEDVRTQHLYRKAIDMDAGWLLMKEWAVGDMEAFFLDTLVEPFTDYAYILNVTDDSGLVSDPSTPMILHAFPNFDDFPINDFKIEVVDAQELLVSLHFSMENIFQVKLYKQEEGKDPFLWRVIEAPQQQARDAYREEDIGSSFFLKVVFKDGTKSDFSEAKRIDQ